MKSNERRDIPKQFLWRLLVLTITLFGLICGDMARLSAQPRTDSFLEKLMRKEKDSLVKYVLAHPEIYRYQFIYTQINRDANNNPTFTNYYFHVDSLQYFYPASTVKLPTALLALEKLHSLEKYGVNMNTPVQYDSSYEGQTPLYHDSTSEDGFPSIAHYVKEVFLISDNLAYNRLYEFVGQQTINHRLHEMGYPDARITRQFAGMTPEQNRHTNTLQFITPDGKILYSQPAAYNPDNFNFTHINKLGKAHLDANDSLIQGPLDFTTSNNLTLYHLQHILQSALFPESVPASQRFHLSDDDYAFVYRYMSQYPSETSYPKYDTGVYYDTFCKFYFKNGGHHIPPYIRDFNKPGWAYGNMTDVSYIVDFKHKVEFMLTATLFVDSDGILNDSKYDYETVGDPFFYRLGHLLYKYELKRKRKYRPDLSRFDIKHSLRPADGRRPIGMADN